MLPGSCQEASWCIWLVHHHNIAGFSAHLLAMLRVSKAPCSKGIIHVHAAWQASTYVQPALMVQQALMVPQDTADARRHTSQQLRLQTTLCKQSFKER